MRLKSRSRRETASNGSNRFITMLATFIAMLAAGKAMLDRIVDYKLAEAREKYPTSAESTVRRAAQAGTVITVVVIGVVAMVGVLIFAQVEEAMPTVDGPLNGTVDNITSGFGDAISFVPIIMLVLLASVVIAVVQRMRA